MDRYDSIIGIAPVSTMISTRGCPYRCNFCFKQPSDKKFRFRKPDKIVDEMEYLADRYKVKEVMFYDDVLTLRREHVVGICENILSRDLKINWETPTRIEHVDKDLLKLMKRAGCIRLRYGVESGDQRILDIMNKKIDIQLAKKVFKLTKSIGIETFAYFMIGYIYETEKTITKTIDFAIELDPDLVMFTVVTPLPQTPLYDLTQKEKIIEGDYWREFTLGKKKGERMPYYVPDAEVWVKRAYRKFYFRPIFIFRKLAKIRSFNMLKKYLKAFLGISIFKMKSK